MRKAIATMGLAALLACSGSGKTGGTSGSSGGTGSAECVGATTFNQSATNNSSPSSATLIPMPDGGGLALFGAPDGSDDAELSGFFSVTGLTPQAPVHVQIVMHPDCATGSCANTFDFTFTGPAGDDLGSSSGNCGNADPHADANGALSVGVAVGASNGQNLGLLITSP